MRLKGLEHAWRRLWIRGLTRAVAARHGDAARGRSVVDAAAPPARVLFLRPDRIGDMVVSTGLLRAIATARPGITLDVLASPANAPIARGEPWVRRVHVLDRRSPWRMLRLVVELRASRYDVVVDCMPTAASLTTLVLMLASGARERVGVAGRGMDDALTVAVPPRVGARHIVDHLSALAAPFVVDVAATDFAPRLTVHEDERRLAETIWRSRCMSPARTRRLIVNVSAGKLSCRWPDAAFVELLRLVARHRPEVCALVVGGPGEGERVSAIARAGGAAAARTETIREALALVACADVVLSGDTGLAHAAVALRRPVVVLHRRGSSGLWGLYGAPGSIVESDEPTLASLPVERVWRALETLLRYDGRRELVDVVESEKERGTQPLEETVIPSESAQRGSLGT